MASVPSGSVPRDNGQQRENGKNQGKRPFQQGGHGQKNKKARKRERDMKSGTHEEILALDIQALRISSSSSDQVDGSEAGADNQPLPEPGSEIEVEVVELSSTGDGLGQRKGSSRVYVVPFTVPGDTVKVKVYRHLREENYTVADLISVVTPSPKRDDSRMKCKYFGECSGCQFQMLDYSEQLRLKKRLVEKAFANFSQLPPELIPVVQDTIGSPLQYGYRTKLTPHFDGPKGWYKKKPEPFQRRPPIGFTPKTARTTMDIEDCPIGTDALRLGMKLERDRMEKEFGKYKRGATLLLRESTQRVLKSEDPNPPTPENAIRVESDKYTDFKTCITDNNGTSTEFVDDFIFSNPAGSFFQNNNSILPIFTEYVRQHILPPPSTVSPDHKPIKHLIDAYSGSGLFTITLSNVPSLLSSTGIDIATASIACARQNATANGLSEDRTDFIAADARELFKSVKSDPDETVVVLDPPRKGCDADFLSQLLHFGPRRIVYVSCNVHTQARDVGVLVRGEVGTMEAGKGSDDADEGSNREGKEAAADGEKMTRYAIESLRGFDFFPQTGHVEGFAVLNRVD